MSWREKVTRWAEQLKRIGDDGLLQATNIYEKDNYQTFQSLAVAMTKSAADETTVFEPLEAALSGKLSPAAVADAAVVDAAGRLLGLGGEARALAPAALVKAVRAEITRLQPVYAG